MRVICGCLEAINVCVLGNVMYVEEDEAAGDSRSRGLFQV